MRRKAVYPGILIIVVLVLSSLLLIGPRSGAVAQNATPCCSQAVGPREIVFPYFSLADGFSSTLLLVSDSPKPLDFILAVHSLAGQTELSPSMTIQPGAKLPIDVRSLLNSLGADVTGTFSQGSVSVYFEGTIMPLVGQMTIENPARHWVQQAEMVENDPGRTDIPAVLSGQWWGLAGGRDATIMVTNASASTVTADVFLAFEDKEHKLQPLVFNANETKGLSVADMLATLNLSVAQAPEGRITIIQRGANPALVAQGRVTDPVTGFSTTLEFPDPARQHASALHASGIPVGTPTAESPYAGDGTFTPHVIVSNLSNSPQNVTITAEYPEGKKLVTVGKKEFDGESGTGVGQMTLATLQAPADSTQDFSLAAEMSQLPLPLPYASLRIQYSGPPGSVIAQVSSVDEHQDLVVDARTMNEGDGWAGSGANPWHVDSQTNSILFLTDESDKPARIGFRVTAGGVTYYLTQLKLNPHETRAIDLRMLRDAQEADFKKNMIPAGATDGSVNWVRLDNVPVMGRVAVISKQSGMASSYDCCTASCTASLTDIGFNPWTMILGAGTSLQCWVYADYYDCNYMDYPTDVTAYATWSSDNTSIMTVSSSGDIQGGSAGTTNLRASYGGWTYDCSYLCQASYVTVGNYATTVVLSISGPSGVPLRNGSSANGVNTIQLTANGTPSGGTFSWSTTSSKVSLSNTTSATVTVTSVSASTAQSDTPVKVTYTLNSQSGAATSYITVQKPTVLVILGPDTTTSEASCTTTVNGQPATGCGVTRTFTYQVLDQIGGGEPIDSSGMQVWDSITIGSTNQLGISGVATTCTGAGKTNSGPCGPVTNSSGEFGENPGLSVCSTACYSSGTCIVPAKTTTAAQTWYVNGFAVQTQQITYECNKVLVNGG